MYDGGDPTRTRPPGSLPSPPRTEQDQTQGQRARNRNPHHRAAARRRRSCGRPRGWGVMEADPPLPPRLRLAAARYLGRLSRGHGPAHGPARYEQRARRHCAAGFLGWYQLYAGLDSRAAARGIYVAHLGAQDCEFQFLLRLSGIVEYHVFSVSSRGRMGIVRIN